MDRAPSFREGLLHDEGVKRLVNGLALSERFHFYLMVCETPRVATGVLDILHSEVSALREHEVRIARLDPYKAHAKVMDPIPFDIVAAEVLAKLVDPPPEMRSSEVIVVADASRAITQDDEAWALFFQRMNERRNVIVKALSGPLLLVLPKRLETVFAHAAPDFWSIRSMAVSVRMPNLPEVEKPVFQEMETPRKAEVPGLEAEEDIEQLETEVRAARERVAANPGDVSAEEALLVWLRRLGQAHAVRGSIDRALAVAEETTTLTGRRLERARSDADATSNLASALYGLGMLQYWRNEFANARIHLEESLAWSRRALEQAPERADVLERLAITLDYLAGLYFDRDEFDRALGANEEAHTLWQRLIEREPSQTEWIRELAANLDALGRILVAQGKIELGLAAHTKGIEQRRRLLEIAPDNAEALDSLGEALTYVGRLHIAQGQLDKAWMNAEEAVAIARRLVARDSSNPALTAHLAIAITNLGVMHQHRDDLDRARACYDESISLYRAVLQHSPGHPEWKTHLEQILQMRAALASRETNR